VKVLDDTLKIASGVRDDKGGKLEPEEQPTRREIAVPADLSLGNGPEGGQQVGQMRAIVSAEMSAVETAVMFASKCDACAYFRPRDWQSLYRRWNDPSYAEGFRTLNRMRGELLGRGLAELANPGDPEAENVEWILVNAMGICGALTECVGEPVVVSCENACPATLENGAPFAAFTPRDSEQKRASVGTYDAILRRAQGRAA
jgi:hypothetical protein